MGGIFCSEAPAGTRFKEFTDLREFVKPAMIDDLPHQECYLYFRNQGINPALGKPLNLVKSLEDSYKEAFEDWKDARVTKTVSPRHILSGITIADLEFGMFGALKRIDDNHAHFMKNTTQYYNLKDAGELLNGKLDDVKKWNGNWKYRNRHLEKHLWKTCTSLKLKIQELILDKNATIEKIEPYYADLLVNQRFHHDLLRDVLCWIGEGKETPKRGAGKIIRLPNIGSLDLNGTLKKHQQQRVKQILCTDRLHILRDAMQRGTKTKTYPLHNANAGQKKKINRMARLDAGNTRKPGQAKRPTQKLRDGQNAYGGTYGTCYHI